MPFNCNINQAISIRKAATGDWVAFGDIKNTHWGADIENRFKAHFTIWIASDSIGRNLRTLKEHLPLSGYLKTVNIQMRPHNLRESVSKSVGFLLGANPERTYRIGVAADMEAHLKTHMGNKVPPFNIQRTTVRCETTRSDTVSMFVGEKDLNRVTEILKKHPFKGPQIIFSDTKSNKEDFEKNLKVNNEIIKRCGAVKVIGANGDIIEALKTVAEQNKALNIIHISTTSHTKDIGTKRMKCISSYSSQSRIIALTIPTSKHQSLFPLVGMTAPCRPNKPEQQRQPQSPNSTFFCHRQFQINPNKIP
ncbi:hypothetical protein SEMRO_1833_G300470.1 [Seminavis robusta]|uniref:Uncharacterized protein n=1 Tax=Seminavis robusta TaxID=568900 RepID=A0A9N8EUW6_9STRA|nr:hypothetical protein SEMRO_1833_G300470.1 [Seminavis robusta]|eukprot:Sro1833_g300470.1 n/a (307) ;mRNA; f:6468-7388